MSQTENTQFYRLIKLTKEFNVGLHTLVETLDRKGIKVELNPNAKIDEQAYAILVKEYGHEISLKAAAQKVDLKPIKDGNVSLSLEEEPEIAPKSVSPAKPVMAARPVAVSESAVASGVASETAASTAPEKAAQPQASPVTTPVVETPQGSVKATVAPASPVNPTPDAHPAQAVQAEEPARPLKPAVSLEQAPHVAAETNTQPAEKPESTATQAQIGKAEKEDVSTSAEAESSESNRAPGLKIVGKINLDPPVVKQKSVKETPTETSVKSSEGGEKEVATASVPDQKPMEGVQATEKPVVPAVSEVPVAPVTEGPKEAETDTHIETVYTKLSGPNVVGKIDLAQFAKKPAVKTDRPGFEDKKKRARIEKKVKVSVDPKAAQSQNTQGQGAQGANKPGHHHAKGKPVQGVKKPAFQAVDEEAVQKQIKDTLARLTAKGSKTKSSKYSRDKRDKYTQRMSEEMERQEMEKSIIQVTEFVTVSELANLMDVPVNQVIGACMNLGLMVSINQRLDAEALVLVAEEFGFQIEFVSVDVHEAKEEELVDEGDLQQRPPIVTVMGHVDHGKTSLLDSIRKSNVIAGEAGGITQHIGAYNVFLPSGRRITFLDTPGHEAFTAMRARGAKVTDVAIIIVAADDSVMPQTIEAINHAQAAGVPMVFAINKIDKPGANGDKIREQLAQMNILVEDWGGKFQVQEVSAKQGKGIDELLEKVLFEADILDLKANPDRPATGSVIESSLDKGRGYVATVLVENGSLRVGDTILSGFHFGKVKAMFNERGKKIDVADPATPVLILGLNGAPQAGENFQVLPTDKEAREIANKREQLIRMQGIRATKHITLDEIGRRIAIGNFKELNIIVKADFDGSVEAMTDSMIKLSTEQVQVNVIHKAVGAISESDVMLAAASNAIIVGFQVRPTMGSRKLAEKEEIEIRTYSIIYDAINEIKAAIEGMHAPEMKEEVTCTVEVLEIFKITKVGTVAGCMVREGKITRNTKIRVLRDGIVIHTGSLGSLKRFKDDVKEVSVGFDCGLNIDNFNDIKEGDMVEGFEMVEVKK